VRSRAWSQLVTTGHFNSSVPIVLVGNKSDLQMDRQVTKEEGQRMAANMKAAFLETSARTNTVIE